MTFTPCASCAPVIDDLLFDIGRLTGKGEGYARIKYGIESNVICFVCKGPYSPFCHGDPPPKEAA